jgi:hypothetical protein
MRLVEHELFEPARDLTSEHHTSRDRRLPAHLHAPSVARAWDADAEEGVMDERICPIYGETRFERTGRAPRTRLASGLRSCDRSGIAPALPRDSSCNQIEREAAMPMDEARRHRLYEAVRHTLGEEEATTLMEHLPPVGWADVATKHDLAQLEARLDARIDGVRVATKHDLAQLETRLDARIDGVRAELKGDIAELRGELKSGLADLRTEVHQMMREQTTRLVAWIIPSLLTVLGVAVTVNFAT